MSSGGVVPPSPSVKDKGALSADLIGQETPASPAQRSQRQQPDSSVIASDRANLSPDVAHGEVAAKSKKGVDKAAPIGSGADYSEVEAELEKIGALSSRQPSVPAQEPVQEPRVGTEAALRKASKDKGTLSADLIGQKTPASPAQRSQRKQQDSSVIASDWANLSPGAGHGEVAAKSKKRVDKATLIRNLISSGADYSEVEAELEKIGALSSRQPSVSVQEPVQEPRVGTEAALRKASEEEAKIFSDSVVRLAEGRIRNYLERYNAGEERLGLTSDAIMSYKRELQQKARENGREFTETENTMLWACVNMAALNPDAAASREFARQVNLSHDKRVAKLQPRDQTRWDDPATRDPNRAEFFFPTPKSIRGLPGADKYPRTLARLFPNPEAETPWALESAGRKLVAHIKAGLDVDTFDPSAPIVGKPDAPEQPPIPTGGWSKQEQRKMVDGFLKDMEKAMDATREAVLRSNKERAKQREQRDAQFRNKITQQSIEASIRSLERHGVTVNDEARKAIVERETAIAERVQVRENVRRAKVREEVRRADAELRKLTGVGETESAFAKMGEMGVASSLTPDFYERAKVSKGARAATGMAETKEVSPPAPGFFQRMQKLMQHVVTRVVSKFFNKHAEQPLADQVASAVDNVKAQLRTDDTSKTVEAGVKQEKADLLAKDPLAKAADPLTKTDRRAKTADPLAKTTDQLVKTDNTFAERTAEVQAELEVAGVRFSGQQPGVAVDISDMSATANSRQQQSASERVGQRPTLESAVREFADAVDAASKLEQRTARQQPAIQQPQSARGR